MKTFLAIGLTAGLLLAGCSAEESRSTGIYVLLNPSELHSGRLENAHTVIPYLLQVLKPTDTLAAASIETANFSEKEIIARVTFDQRPSVANDQKRAFRNRLDRFVRQATGSPFTDFSGGILQAIDTLNQTGPYSKSILILSNLSQRPADQAGHDIPFHLAGFNVVVLEMGDPQPGSRAVKNYRRRVDEWRAKVEGDDGRWFMIENVRQLDAILKIPASNGRLPEPTGRPAEG